MNNHLTSKDIAYIRKQYKTGEQFILHVTKEETAIAIMELFHQLNIKWAGGQSSIKDTKYKQYTNKTCYFIEEGKISYTDLPRAIREYPDSYIHKIGVNIE